MRFLQITEADDPELERIIRHNLEEAGLDIPGTAYYDESLHSLSRYYLQDAGKRFYFVLKDENGRVKGGIGLAECSFFKDCAELQKLYLADDAKGNGLGYEMISRLENKARELGYRRIYLETHDVLAAAIHEYRKAGYEDIERPTGVIHSAMNRFFFKELDH